MTAPLVDHRADGAAPITERRTIAALQGVAEQRPSDADGDCASVQPLTAGVQVDAAGRDEPQDQETGRADA